MTGVLVETGKDMVLGAKIYFDRVNNQRGIHGKRIAHVFKADGYEADAARVCRHLTINMEVQ